jgi:hypothetical protein
MSMAERMYDTCDKSGIHSKVTIVTGSQQNPTCSAKGSMHIANYINK